MKVDRVILCWDGNPLYDHFWNLYSKIWCLKYGITPTLFFVGSHEKMRSLNLSKDFGEVYFLPQPPEVIPSNADLNWSVTWAFFWGAAQFKDETCMTCGLDQLPMSSFFFESLSDVPDDKYVIGFADAYKGYGDMLGYRLQDSLIKDTGLYTRTPADYFPSSHHVAKGSLYEKVYHIEKSWEHEVKKVFYFSKERYKIKPSQKLWGLDECYSSELIFNFHNPEVFHFYDNFHSHWHPNRIDRGFNADYDLEKLKNGSYSEYHSHRPYTEHKQYIDTLLHNLAPNISLA